MRKPRGFLFIVLGLLAALVFAATAAATPDGAVSTAPWISSDKADYAPGERVTLSGGGWHPGEGVNIRVDDDDSRTWSRSVDVTADAAGNISDAFDLPEWFVALYTVKATGEQSGVASTTFTDGNVTLHLPAGEGVANMTVTVNVYGTAQNPNTSCSGSPVRVETVVVSSPGASANIPGFGNANLSARLVSVSTTTSGKAFDRWTGGTTGGDSGIVIPGSPQPCISSGGTGSNGNVTDAYARFRISNTAPTCTAGAATTDEDTARAVTLSCTDPQGDSLTYAIVAGPANGTLSGSGSNRTYTPAANFNGSDSLTFRASDGSLNSETVTFSLTVEPVNDAPAAAARPAAVAMNEDGGAESVEVGGSDVETPAAGLVFVITQAPARGTLKRGATALGANDTFTGTPETLTYTPDANFNGSDSFEFEVRDTGDPAGCASPAPGCSAGAGSPSVTVPITVRPVNDAPICSNGSASTPEDTARAITLVCADVDGDGLTYAIVSGPSHAALSGAGATRTYTPSADYHGSDSFTFAANDGEAESNHATFDLTVTPVNDVPVAQAQSVTTGEDAGKMITVTAADVDGDALTFAVTALPEHGRLYPGATAGGAPLTAAQLPYALSGNEVTYRPDADYHGPDGFDFEATDGAGHSAAAPVSITVAPVNDDPVAADDTASGSEDEAVVVEAGDLLVNDDDVDGDSLTVTGVDDASGGDVALEGDVITFTPDPNLCGDGAASFAYSIGDGNGGSARARVTIDLECVNDDPTLTAAATSVAVNEGDTAATTGAWADVDGHAVALAASVGTVIRNADGTWSWSFGTSDGPAQSQTVTISASDGNGGSAQTTFGLTVENVAPSVRISGATAVAEGDVEEYAFTVSDPGADSWTFADGYPACGSNGALVDGSGESGAAGGSFRCRFPDGPKPTSVAVKVRDDDGGVSADVENVTILEVVISNVAPAITAAANQESSEGQSKAFELGAFVDPGDEAAAWRVEIDWGDGAESESFASAEPGSLGTRSHTFADDGTYTVTVSVADADGDFDEIMFDVDVANVAPEVTAAATQASDEGETTPFSLGSFADPGPDGDWRISVDWGDGSAATSLGAATPGSLGTKPHAYADNGEYTVTVRVTEAGDGERPSGVASFRVAVSNVAPTLVLSGASDVNEGDTKTYAFTVSDPGANDTWAFAESTPTCGANGELVAGSLEPATAGPHTAAGGTFKCFFPEGGTSVDPVTTKVVTKIVDNDGGKSADVQSVEVIDVNINNVAPMASLGHDGPVAEGSPVTATFTDQSDPSADDTAAGFRYAYRCDGTAFPSSPSYAAASTSPSHECTYGDDGPRTVRARIVDRNGGFSEYRTTFGVTNVAPTAADASFVLDPITGQATASFSYSDFGWLDTHLGSYLTWSAGTPGSGATATATGSGAPAATGSVAETRTLEKGCHTLVVTGVAKDDDGAESAPLTLFSGAQTSVHGKGFRPPIVDNERNVARLGNVVPVKVLLQNACTGASVTDVDLYISLHQGTGDEAIEGTSVVAESVSTADTTGKMRTADGMYIYNLSTKGLKAATDYTIRIRTGSTTGPRILQAVIHPKK